MKTHHPNHIIPMLQPFVSYFRSGSIPRTRMAMGNIHGNRPVEELAAHSPRATRCTAHLVAASRCGKGTFFNVFSPPFRRVWRKLLEDRIIGHKSATRFILYFPMFADA